nr:MAG TPA: hypothetical protein [Caudoviricetes sp.]
MIGIFFSDSFYRHRRQNFIPMALMIFQMLINIRFYSLR